MTLLSWPQKSCLVEIRKGFWRYAGLGEDSANSVQQRINAARGLRRARPAAHRFAASFTRGALGDSAKNGLDVKGEYFDKS